jgi:hypothetical protein
MLLLLPAWGYGETYPWALPFALRRSAAHTQFVVKTPAAAAEKNSPTITLPIDLSSMEIHTGTQLQICY